MSINQSVFSEGKSTDSVQKTHIDNVECNNDIPLPDKVCFRFGCQDHENGISLDNETFRQLTNIVWRLYKEGTRLKIIYMDVTEIG